MNCKHASILRIAVMEILKWINNPRVFISFIATFLFSHHFLASVRTFVRLKHHGINPVIMPLYLSDSYMIFIYLLLAVMIFSNAPFLDAAAPYELIRSGRSRWFLGKILYVLMASVIYSTLVFISTIIFFVPFISFEKSWGKVIFTLARTTAGDDFGGRFIDLSIVNTHSALKASIYVFIQFSFQVVIIALIVTVINIAIKRSLIPGILCASAYAILPSVADFWDWDFIRAYWPSSFLSLKNIYPIRPFTFVNMISGLGISSLIIILLIIIGIWRFKSYQIEVMSELN